MTNKEKYKQAFSTLHASEKILLEVDSMEKNKKAYLMKRTMAACAATAIIFGSMTTAYATNLGGIREKLTVWFHGEQTDVHVIDHGDGSYTYSYTDEDGETKEMGGGGVAIDENGNETPLSAEDVLSAAGMGTDVDADEAGDVWLYFKDRKINITDLFGEDGVCRVAVTTDEETAYFTIRENGGGGYEFEMTNDRPDNAEQFTMRKH